MIYAKIKILTELTINLPFPRATREEVEKQFTEEARREFAESIVKEMTGRDTDGISYEGELRNIEMTIHEI